jgi:DNA-directed RNA polymerase specialized sigma24 family protein
MDFWEIYDFHHGPVKTFISKMVGDQWIANDLTQDTFIKVRENLNGLKDDSKLMPWIFRNGEKDDERHDGNVLRPKGG